MNGKKLQVITNIFAKHGLYKDDGTWYHHLNKFPGILFDKEGYIFFNNKEEYESNKYLKHTKHLHIANGIKNVPGYIKFSIEQKKALLINEVSLDFEIKESVIRKLRQLELVVRNKSLVSSIKILYNNTCQLCRMQIHITGEVFYSEVHHIRPLGFPHNGPDVLSNLLCVCANCHVLLDLGAIKLSKQNIAISLHDISVASIEYHNSSIFKNLKVTP